MNDDALETYKRGLVPWADDDDGALFLALMDAYTDRLEEILEPAGFRLHKLTNDDDVEIPASTTQEVRHAITGAGILARITQLLNHYVLGASADDAAAIRVAFSEFFLAGVLFQLVHPDALNTLQKSEAYRASYAERGRKSAAARTKWQEAARTAFDAYRFKNPAKTKATEIMIGMDLSGRIARPSDEALLTLIRRWMRAERERTMAPLR